MEKIQEVIEILNKLQDEGYIKVLNWDTRELILRPKAAEHVVDPIENWIDEYRAKFKGKKPGAMGDRNACVIKFKELFLRRPDITKEKILLATDRYITAESGNRYKYLMQADYFISKSVNNTKEGRVSKLEAYCDELDDTIETQVKFDYDI